MNKIEIDEAMKVAEELIKSHGLEMKLKSAEFISGNDGDKLRYNFTKEEGEIDLRYLVRDLATHFKVRIDLRQVKA